MDALQVQSTVLPLIARALLALVFLTMAGLQACQRERIAGAMALLGVPCARLGLAAGVGIELAGGLSVLLGYRAQWGAAALVMFLTAATVIFHRDLRVHEHRVQVLKNLAILGGLLMMVAFGSGPFSLDEVGRHSQVEAPATECSSVG